MIREISETGAKIEIPEYERLPEKLYLLGSMKWAAYESELVWQRGNFAGLHFQREHDLASATDPEILRLKFVSVGGRTASPMNFLDALMSFAVGRRTGRSGDASR